MEKYQSEFALVKKILRENPEGLSIQEIAELLKMNRITVSKYLDILQIQGQVDAKRIGTSKVYMQSNRLPASSISKVCPFFYIMIDKNNMIAEIHHDFLKFLHGEESDFVGKRIDLQPIDFLKDQELLSSIKSAIRGKGSVIETDVTLDKKDHTFKISCLPVVFTNGKPGMVLIFENLTDVKDINRLVQQLDSRYQALIEDQVGYILRFLPDGTITYVNDTYCRDVGREKEALIGSVYHPFLPEEDKEKVRRHFASLTIENPVDIIEHRAIMANGQVRWQRWKDRALFDRGGNIIEYQSVGIDITDFKHAQEKLRTSYEHLEDIISLRTQELQDTNKQLYTEIAQREAAERKLNLTQFAMDNSADMVIWFNKEGKIIYANNSATSSLGYTNEVLVTMQWADLLTPDVIEEWEHIWENCKGITHYPMELVLSRNEGSTIPADIHFNHLKYNGQEYCCAFIRDITERTRIMESLQESREQLRNFLQSLPIGLYRKEPDGTVVFANPYLTKILGYPTPGDLSAVSLDSMYAKPQQRKELTEKLIRNRSVVNETLELRKNSGELFWARISEIGVLNESGELKYIDGIVEDITEKKNVEEGLKNAQRTLQFLNHVTIKEIRNELFTLSGYLDFVMDSASGDQLEYLNKIEKSAHHIRLNIDFGNRYQNIGGTSPVWLKLHDTFLYAISHIDPGEVRFHVDLENIEIWADPHIELVFTILVEDSLLHGEGVKNITVQAEEHKKGLKLLYKDDGCGIQQDLKQKIFDRDYNPENIPRLYLTKEILSITDITIRETGEPEKGVRFEIDIPRFRLSPDLIPKKSPASVVPLKGR